MTREQAINEIKSWAIPSKNGREVLETLIPELAESEDERIRKALIETVKCIYAGDTMFLSEQQRDRYLAYLEKQKDLDKMIVVSPEVWDKAINDAYENGKKDGEKQKEPHYTKRNALFDKCVENCDPTVMKRVSDEVDEMLGKEQKPIPANSVGLKEQKPSWSEEDEKMISKITDAITGYHPTRSTKENEEMIAFLKSLRPSWKPSEGQLEALNALNLHGDLSYVGQQNQLISLYQDLKKL